MAVSPTLVNLRALDILEEPAAVAHPDETLSKVISRFRSKGLSELPVVTKEETSGGKPRLLGLLCLPVLLRGRRLPLSARVENLLIHPPRLTQRLSLLEVTKRLLDGDFRTLPVIDKKQHLLGIVSRLGVLEQIMRMEAFGKLRVEEVMTPEPRSLLINDNLNRARNLMRTLDVKTLPVVDQAGRLVGVVGQRELLAGSELSSDGQSPGDRAGDRQAPHLHVDSLMRTTPVTISSEMKLAELLGLIVDQNVSTVFVVKEQQLAGVIQTTDLLELLARPEEEDDKVHIQLSGLESEDPMLIEDITSRLHHSLKVVSHNFQPLSCHLHFSSEGTSSRTHFTVRLRLQTSKKLFVARGEDWSEMAALRESLQRLESQTQRAKGR